MPVHWKVKAAIQRCAGALPDGLSYPVYYGLQRTFGGLRRPNPTAHLAAALSIVERIQRHGRPVRAARFLEVGTGRHLTVPLALWLCGADHVTTIDLNPYLKPVLVFEHIDYMRAHPAETARLFAPVCDGRLFQERFRLLTAAPRDLAALTSMIGVTYLAPADASRLPLPAASIEYHISVTVLEHIPPAALERIFAEGRRLLVPDGLFVHYVDFSDHFSHADPSLPAVHFLRFSDEDWQRLAGNRYAYHNRLRIDEFEGVMARAGTGRAAFEPTVDGRSEAALRAGLQLDARFAGKPVDVNATIDAWVVAARDRR